jgi:hypothetical protein
VATQLAASQEGLSSVSEYAPVTFPRIVTSGCICRNRIGFGLRLELGISIKNLSLYRH